MVFDHTPATPPPYLNYGLLIQNFVRKLFSLRFGLVIIQNGF